MRTVPGVGSVGPPGVSVAVTVTPAVFVAFGTPEVKSAELLSVSTIAPLRASAVVLVRPGAASVSTLAVAPYPTRSLTFGAVEHEMPQPTSGIWFVTRATTPDVPDMGMLPVASGVGSERVPPAPAASWTRYLPWAGMLPVRFVIWKTEPAAEAY